MKENEEKNSCCNQNLRTKEKEKNDALHYKKIQIKPIKKDNINNNYKPNNKFDNSDKNKFNQNINKTNHNKNENKKIEEDKNFMFEDINNQLDEILENIENDGIEEINKKIKLLNEDKNMFNTISYNNNENLYEKDWNYKKIDNKNKLEYKRNNKIINDKNTMNHINNYKYYNQNNKHYIHENRNITNNRYLFSNVNNTYRNWKEENNCDNDECDNYLNKTNISLFYKYNKLYNPKKSDEE